jgi:ubiquinone/menaquinone biosynthesis C-methylase UbiE/uncharacterized protein YbaR (Trm112 family)
LQGVTFVCPLCRKGLSVLRDGRGYRCSSCKKTYSLHDGIPDFRVFPDPYLSFQEDHDRTEIVLAALERYELEPLLEYYWSFSDITPETLRPKFVRSAMLGEQRARRVLRTFEDGTFKEPFTPQRVLEIGSGTGNFLALAMQRYDEVIGIDIAMRWLHVSRRRFMDMGLPVPPLVCCCAEYLPFPDASFDLVVASSTLEFARDPSQVVSECARMLTRRGVLYLNTVNRYTLAMNPYAYLWGVGFLPRAWQARYVRWRRQASYDQINLLSLRELNKLAEKHFATREIALPDIDSALLAQFSFSTRLQMQLYKMLRRLPLFSSLLKRVGPSWDVKLQKD